MKHLRTIIALAAAFSAIPALASYSLNVEARLEHTSFVLGEGVFLTVDVANFGSSTYIVNDTDRYRQNKLEIRVKKETGAVLDCLPGLPFGDVMIMPKESETLKVNVARLFNLDEGRYFMQVYAHRGEETAISKLLTFEVVRGIEIGAVTRPIPEYDTISRTYALLYWPREGVEAFFLKVVEHPGNGLIGLVQLGNIVRIHEPCVEFKDDGIMTITHQANRDFFVRTTIRSTRSEMTILGQERVLDPNPSPLVEDLLRLREERTRDQVSDENDGFVRRRRKPAE